MNPSARPLGGRPLRRSSAETRNQTASPSSVPTAEARTEKVWTPPELLKWTTGYFQRKNIEAPRLEAELLLAGALNWPRIRLYSDFDRPVPKEVLATYREFVRRRAEDREPSQYILGKTEFLGLTFKVNRHALIPRPETEELATWAIDRLRTAAAEATPLFDAAEQPTEKTVAAGEPRACDLCTGGGCVALSVAHYAPAVRFWACDISAEALTLARENASLLGDAGRRVTFLEGDLFAPLPAELKGRLTLITANPPYVKTDEALALAPEVGEHEPKTALFGGADGLEIIRRICAQAADFLRPGGWLGMEIGAEQGAAVREMLSVVPTFQDVEIRRDCTGKDRFAVAQKRGPTHVSSADSAAENCSPAGAEIA